MKNLIQESTNNFDFFSNEKTEQKNSEKTIQFKKFKNLIIYSVASVGVTSILVWGGISIHNHSEKAIDEKIDEAQLIVKANPVENINKLIEKEKDAVRKTFDNNQVLINQYAQYKEMVEILNFGGNISSKMAANNRLRKDSLNSLEQDLNSINLINNAMTSSREVKKSELLDSQDFNKFLAWSENVKNNKFMYVGGLINIKHDIESDLEELKRTQTEMVTEVNQRLKENKFDLNAAQKKITNQVQTETDSQVAEIQSLRNEVKDSQTDDVLTDNDVTEVKTTMSQLQEAAVDKIASDRKTVEDLINKNQQNNPNSQNNIAVQNTAQPVQSNNGMTMFDYYLLAHWMNAGSSYDSGYQAGSSARYNNVVISSADMYSIKKPDSYLNKNLTNTPNITKSRLNNANITSNIEKMRSISSKTENISAIKAKVEAARAKIESARVKVSTAKTNAISEAYKSSPTKSYSVSPSRVSSSSGGRRR